MPLAPGYGGTPLPHDEFASLRPSIVGILDAPVTRAAVYDLEQGVQDQVSEELMTAAIEGSLLLDELLSDHFIRDLHLRLYGDIWVWAGRLRQPEVNIGVAPEQIAVELRSTLDNIRYRWEHTDDFISCSLGVVRAETVRVHPFTDGNGRTTRLLADLVYIAAQEPVGFQYYWDIDKTRYIELLREFDGAIVNSCGLMSGWGPLDGCRDRSRSGVRLVVAGCGELPASGWLAVVAVECGGECVDRAVADLVGDLFGGVVGGEQQVAG